MENLLIPVESGAQEINISLMLICQVLHLSDLLCRVRYTVEDLFVGFDFES